MKAVLQSTCLEFGQAASNDDDRPFRRDPLKFRNLLPCEKAVHDVDPEIAASGKFHD